MNTSLRAALLALLGCVAGCSVEAAAQGDGCQRSTQCAAGLACVQGKCSSDLQAIARHDSIPKLGLDAAAADGGRLAAGPLVPAQRADAAVDAATGQAARADAGRTLDAATPPPIRDAAASDSGNGNASGDAG